ncbi:GGDEF domain-containing protein [Salinimonas marina]|uniref:diguanylate cyclase n=1 Tax=Salinimonas marina TaxID=2785918 RepID=A0A7S9DVJ8_9ALTE|nr:GGDEF domain-containing protein [Salinimonas marina]QPG04767.1 GGDEF domain-containing protein [Salinimonas marina]
MSTQHAASGGLQELPEILTSQTPVADYYRLSLQFASKIAEAEPVTDELLEALTPYPRVQLEARLLQWAQHTPTTYPKRNLQLQQLLEVAKQNNWPRLERWGIRLLVERAMVHGDYMTAIMNIQRIVGSASAIQPSAGVFDYPLSRAYLDMADAFFYLGDAGMSLEFCQFYKQFLTHDAHQMAQGMKCEIRAYTHNGAYRTVWPLLSEFNQHIAGFGLSKERVEAALAASRVYLHKGDYRLAEEFAKEAKFLARHNQLEFGPWRYRYAQLRLEAALGRKQVSLAREFWQQMLNAYGETTTVTSPAYEHVRQLELEATLLGLEQNYQQANALYRQIHSLEHEQKKQFRLLEQLSAFTNEISRQQLSFLQLQAQLNKSQSRNMKYLAMAAVLTAVILLLMLLRVVYLKRRIEQNVVYDGLTGLDARWFALSKIQRKLTRRAEPGCVVLLDIDHFKDINRQLGPCKADKVLIELARFFKYEVGTNNIIGRYAGEQFVFNLSNSLLDDAIGFVDKLKQALAQHQSKAAGPLSLANVGPIRFCAAVVEADCKTSMDDIMELCEQQLKKAKSRGRNQTRSASLVCRAKCQNG